MLKLNAQGHQYLLDSPDQLRYRSPGGRELSFPYRSALRFRASPWTGRPCLGLGKESIPLAPLSPEDLRTFLLEFFRHWSERSPEAAKKAAFDYADSQSGFVPVAFFACLLVGLPVAVALLADSHQQFRCTRAMQEHAVPGQIRVVRATKKDSRAFKVKLEFTEPGGRVFRAEDLLQTGSEKDIPPFLPILYSPEQPECWSLTKSPDSQEVNWARRRYFAWFGLFLGIFFLAATGLGLVWAAARRAMPRPGAAELLKLFGL